ncbi:GTPase IMAP family member GIMD1-like [Toxotes jaculatrix]|uniref:GTPase IMAP family member GIMD1-like n=1 Tax=Toxotes jaculatrix TaxID=941984 RepID=UPI001B3AC14F|nr:GTPase IMAP family member GIMD1-like [Toxotes jaculatrix]
MYQPELPAKLVLIMEHSHGGSSFLNTLGRWSRQDGNSQRDVLALNVLLLGDRQSGRSSVGNALIGGHEFQTGTCVCGVSMTTEYQALSRNFPQYFRRQGAESDLMLRVIDTPPLLPQTKSVHELCPEGVHVLVLVVRADLPHEHTHLEQCVESSFGPEWRLHTLLILTHADHLKKAGLHPSVYLAQTADWLGALASEVAGGVLFLDNSCDWPLIRGQPLRDRLLRLSARNHHRALKVRTEVSLGL